MSHTITEGIMFDTQEELDAYKAQIEQGEKPVSIAYKTMTADAPTNPPNAPTGKATNRKGTPTKKTKNPTDKKEFQHNKIKQDELVKWTVFVQPETKIAVSKAVEKAGTTLTDWIDSRLREVATAELTKKAQPPAKPEDVADLMGQLEKRLADQQAAALKAQGEQMGGQIQELAAAINNRPASVKEWLFGKPKQD
jgi:hypothetical protein